MPANKKPRKKYVRKISPFIKGQDTITTLFDGDKPLHGELRDKVLLTVHIAAQNLARGESDQDDWGALVTAMNVCLILCEKANNKNIGLQAVYDACNALIEVQERSFRMEGRRVLKGEELVAINGGIHVFEEMVDAVTKRQYVWASDQIEKRMREGRSIGVGPDRKCERYVLRAA
jgi:hypothetical protein